MIRTPHAAALTGLLLCVFVADAQETGADKGYHPRACGLDLEHVDVFGGHVVYVDSRSAGDETGDGSAERPYATIARALESVDGSDEGGAYTICIAGTFHETVTLTRSGAPGHYERDGFQYPTRPAMIVGWDRDGDGEYPPYDSDDEAVLDGRGELPWAIVTRSKLSFIELAHLTIQDYGYAPDNCGALKLFHWGTGSQSHASIHDVEFRRINKREKDASGKIVFSFWGGPMTYVAFENNLVDEYSSYFCRGAPPDEARHFRFRDNTLRMFGTRGESFVTGWKLWGHHRGVEILDNVIDCNAHAWQPEGHVSGIGVCQGTQDWVIRGNLFIDTGVTLQPFAKGYPFERRLDNILIDRNAFRATYDGWTWGRFFIGIQGYPDAPIEQSVEDVTISGNDFSGSVGYAAAVVCNAGYGQEGSPGEPGTVLIEGNTMSGPFTRSGYGAVTIGGRTQHKQQNIVLRDNVITNVGEGGANVVSSYAPSGFIAGSNTYDPIGVFRWGEPRHWITMDFAAWRQATGQDASSILVREE